MRNVPASSPRCRQCGTRYVRLGACRERASFSHGGRAMSGTSARLARGTNRRSKSTPRSWPLANGGLRPLRTGLTPTAIPRTTRARSGWSARGRSRSTRSGRAAASRSRLSRCKATCSRRVAPGRARTARRWTGFSFTTSAISGRRPRAASRCCARARRWTPSSTTSAS